MSFGDGIDWDNEARRAAKELPPGADSFELIDRLKAAGAGPRLLDCGCNIGRYCPPFRAADFEYVGVDQSEVALKVARERYPGVEFVQSFLWDMLFYRPFDVAVTIAVLQHNKHDEKRRILSRIAGALKPGGLFAMQESTVLEDTPTQLRQAGWISMVEGFGFKLLDAWHPNPEYGVCDHYMFQRLP
jgi:SAM-dependent methyltransferase